MQSAPAIAILTSNILMGIGLKTILEKIIPVAEVELFGSFDEFEQAEPERFFHYFVSMPIFVRHSTFFRKAGKTILLCNGAPTAACADMPTIDTRAGEEAIVRDILQLHQTMHRHRQPLTAPTAAATSLSAREVEVLTLIARGYLSKQIAHELKISLTTVISHRRNIAEKLNIHSVAGLAIYALTEGYIDGEEL